MFAIVLPLVVFLLPLAWSPGPGNLTFAANGARFGFRATLLANLGYHIATWLITVAIGLGALRVVERVPGAFALLQLCGAAYVLWLAWRLFRSGIARTGAEARPIGFVDGAVLLLLNPKAYVIIALMFSQFADATAGTTGIVLIATVFTLNNLMAFSAWTLLGDRLLSAFRAPAQARRINTLFGVLLAGVAFWMTL